MNIVINSGPKELEQIKADYKKYESKSNNPHVQFMAKAPKLVVNIYNSGKVMFQGELAEKAASNYGYKADTTSTTSKQYNTIGTDEVGNGSYFGGLAVVASYVKQDDINFLKKLGVDDSKNLTDTKIRQIAPQLKNKIQNVALLVTPSKYNEVIDSGYNAVSIKVALHNQAIFLLEKQLEDSKVDQVIIDAFTTASNYNKYLKNEANRVINKVSLIQKAEGQYLAVAVSSIIARSLFLENLDKLSKLSGYKLPSGAGSKSDKVAANIIKNNGLNSLNEYAKLHFKNTDKAKNLSKKI